MCFGVFSAICFELSVLVKMIVWKDSSLKWPIMCRVECKTLLTHSHNYYRVHSILRAQNSRTFQGLKFAVFKYQSYR